MKQNREIKFIAHVVRWFDKVNGNTYHSVKIERVADGQVIAVPMTYGYGDHYRQTGLNLLLENQWINGYTKETIYLYERENNYPIIWNLTDGLKRECVANGKI